MSEGRPEAANLTGTSRLTKRGQQRLERYIEALIDIAAQGNAGFAFWHADDVARIVLDHQRKRWPND